MCQQTTSAHEVLSDTLNTCPGIKTLFTLAEQGPKPKNIVSKTITITQNLILWLPFRLCGATRYPQPSLTLLQRESSPCLLSWCLQDSVEHGGCGDPWMLQQHKHCGEALPVLPTAWRAGQHSGRPPNPQSAPSTTHTRLFLGNPGQKQPPEPQHPSAGSPSPRSSLGRAPSPEQLPRRPPLAGPRHARGLPRPSRCLPLAPSSGRGREEEEEAAAGSPRPPLPVPPRPYPFPPGQVRAPSEPRPPGAEQHRAGPSRAGQGVPGQESAP